MIDVLLMATVLPTSFCANEAQTLKAAADRIETAYVLEDVAVRVADELRRTADEVPIKTRCTSKEEFARALTRTLRDISGDGHFYVEEITEEEDDDWIPAWRASGYKRGQGVTDVRVLDGNIGYIRIKSFYELEPAFPYYRAAFDIVMDTDALIIDLRDNGGGSPQTTWPIQWTFLESGSPSPMTMESRIEAPTPREEPPILWRRYGTQRPLAILVNGDTFSAPEAVAYTLQTADRATIIGSPSGGGAHLLDSGVDLNTGFTLYTPTQRPVSVETGENWEGIGITPDIAVPSEEAIETATAFLREEIGKQAPE
ncbi:MAG: S41 family peptidase [Pseudomonadota bacterium]